MKNWDLNDLYQGFDETYENDIKRFDELTDEHIKWIHEGKKDDISYIDGYLKIQEEISKLVRTLYSYASLTMATDVTNQVAPGYLAKLQRISRKSTAEDVIFSRYLTTVDLDKLALKSPMIKKYLFNLKKEQTEASHLLSEKEEVLYAKLRELASGSWGMLQSLTTANLPVSYRDKEITLSEVRNLANDGDASVRCDAYEAELKAYAGIEDQVSMALSNIKREVVIMNELRGYESALEKTLNQSNMTADTLNSMIESMKDFRPHFERYLKAKATYLGHKDGLPFYDMFAPVGKLDKTYTFDEAKDTVLEAFYGYSPRLGDFAKKAFEKEWIDVYPRKGKRGGAFC
ncbi:MAG: oligoendopeptidase F, partial [Tenericutes bacterium HGW-Tenericutes-7]